MAGRYLPERLYAFRKNVRSLPLKDHRDPGGVHFDDSLGDGESKVVSLLCDLGLYLAVDL
ncbi:MAG: hypothetical protein JRJ18_11090 [Deltaproteobacteria bacterium]|nr:hypothetical protein [Deltaproteobacteria bacterium]